MAFLLDRLRESFEDDAEEVDFEDLNYKVGNTSGMDVTGQIPSEIAERVGQLAQRSGGEMEIQIENPSSFFIDRENLYTTVNGLDIDISIHSDPNVGYTSPYQVGEGGGFDGTHNYFTQYLESFTSFKLEAEAREDLKFGKENGIKIGRINPHVSVSPLPQTEQERAQGVALDPLGYSLTKLQKNEMDNRREKGKNIWDNEKFLRRFYKLFIVDELEDNEYQLFNNFYIPYSTKIDKVWREKQNETMQEIYERRPGEYSEDTLEDKIKIIRVAGQVDPAIANTWLDILENSEDFEESVTFEIPTNGGTRSFEVKDLVSLDQLIKSLSPNYGVSELRRLPEVYYYLKEKNLEGISRGIDSPDFDDDKKEKLWELLQEPLEDAIDGLWSLKPEDVQEDVKEGDPRVSLIPVNAKRQALSNHLEIPDRKILEKTFSKHKHEDDGTGIRQHLENMYAGEKEYFTNGDNRKPSERHENFLRSVTDQFEQQMWQESNVFYRVGPAWISSSEKKIEGENGPHHKGWKAPKFLWKLLVERKHGENYDLDLENPRKENGYFEALENDREFQMDVAAAVAGTYMWSMFTQVEKKFEMDEVQRQGENLVGKDYDTYTWIEWMNKYGIGVNMETMAGNPRQFFKLWRPIHVVAACRAINITARNRLESEGQLGDREEMAPELDECPVKFTIDMEHVSSFGVDPIKEMEILKDQEKELLENPIEIDGEKIYTPGDPEKPLSKMLRMYHLTKPGHETSGGVGHTHGPFREGDKDLYSWLFEMVKWGFTRTGEDGERASVMYEVGGEQVGTVYQAKLSMDLIELGVSPEELDPSIVDPSEEPESEREALIARFYGMERSTYNREWAKVEEHAFDPLKGLLEAEEFDFTYSGNAAIEQGGNRPNEWKEEEYK